MLLLLLLLSLLSLLLLLFFYYYYHFISPTHIQWKTIKNKQYKKVIVNKLHHIISIDLSHSNKNGSGTFSPSIKELLNKIQLKRRMAMNRR